MQKDDLGQHSQLIDEIVNAVLKGKVRTESQVYEWLVREIESGTEIEFETVLRERALATQAEAEDHSDEMKQAKAIRSVRALKLLQNEWKKYQENQRATGVIAVATQTILSTSAEQRLSEWIRVSDPNLDNPLSLDDLKQLVRSLNQLAQLNPAAVTEIEQLGAGTERGLASSQVLDGYLFEWMYASQRQVGFAAELPESRGPWKLWANHSHSTLLKQLFQTLAEQGSLVDWTKAYPFDAADLVELAISLRNIQQRLVAWFEQQPYDSEFGTQSAISTFLTFASLWCQFAQGMAEANRHTLEQACFQVVLQLMRSFSQRPYFPLYGGVLALLSGEYLEGALSYLNEPLRQVAGTQAKARILTLLGYSYRTRGRYDLAIKFHQQALDIARAESDQLCEIANLNHLSRIAIAQKNYTEALRYGQQALILARQTGELLGKAHALTNVGYAEVLTARAAETTEPEVYETAMNWLQQGLKLSETLDTATALGEVRQCQSLCQSSLGIAYVTLAQFATALPYLQKGLQFVQQAGDLDLQALNFTYLAQAYKGLGEPVRAAGSAALGMYLFHQTGSTEWQHAAGLLLELQGEMGKDVLWQVIAEYRPQIIALIGVDGYDELPKLLVQFQQIE
jgi:tetratricopeptide (TPR) repeat protein